MQADISYTERDGVSLAYREIGAGQGVPLLFVHGFGCNAGHFRHQQPHFARSHPTVAVDLRGHGQSDAPLQDYDIGGFADDLRWLCGHLGLQRPVVIGHSMGGNIALKLAVRHPELVQGIVMIDTFIDADDAFVRALRELAQRMPAMAGPESLYDLLSGLLFLPSDDPGIRQQILDESVWTPWHVLTSAFAGQILRNDSIADLRRLKIPAAYIGADGLPMELARIAQINPHVMRARTLGVGHFSPLLAPDQINAMLCAFFLRLRSAMSATAMSAAAASAPADTTATIFAGR
ncbi:MAG TPA: alpha/beta hydrolase [Bradyrhizobium sp.]|jgi:pimeloyl-ACP methyl ester carboxylesterase|nr:alpha/beta hydrolase [Bradyrhizobium sp.]